jgi:hypothetical protein
MDDVALSSKLSGLQRADDLAMIAGDARAISRIKPSHHCYLILPASGPLNLAARFKNQ